MKTPKGFGEHDAEELRQAKRLEPMRKSGKERHMIYSDIDDENEGELLNYSKRESALDYLDDEEDI